MATLAPITGARTRAPAILPPKRRRVIELQIEAHLRRVDLLIARLDRVDAPLADLEPEDDRCAAADDGCGRLEAHQARAAGTREGWAVPRYGINQDSEPLNYREEVAAGQARVLGLVSSATGGWKRPN